MKALIISAICSLLTLAFFPVNGQTDTLFYGVNGKLTQASQAKVRIVVNHKRPDRLELDVSRRDITGWKRSYLEKIEVERDGTFHIRQKGESSAFDYDRQYVAQSDGTFRFTEYNEKGKLRRGTSLSKIPLVLHGEVTEYYPGGKVRSVSNFRHNELVSNQNWLENGEKYIDSVFYSVDEEPLISGGVGRLHQHILEAFRNSRIDLAAINGNILVGFVVMENGTIDGIRIVRGLDPQLNGIAARAISSFLTSWKPARLNGQVVRYFQLFPINFISREVLFQSIEFDGSMLHYDRN